MSRKRKGEGKGLKMKSQANRWSQREFIRGMGSIFRGGALLGGLLTLSSSLAWAADGKALSPGATTTDLSEKAVYDQRILDAGLPNGSAALSFPAKLTKEIAIDTSGGKKCLLNNAEVEIAIPPVARVKGSLKLDQTVSISSFKGAFETPSAGSDPYWTTVSFEIGDLTFKSSGALDISVECLGLDSSVTIKLKKITGSLRYSPPVKGSTKFTLKKASISIGQISVDAIPRTKLFTEAIATLVEEQLKKALEGGKGDIEAGLASALRTGLGSTFGEMFLDLRFHSQVVPTSKRIKDLSYYSTGRHSLCTNSGPCAVYSIKRD